jgi:hypothetical protein
VSATRPIALADAALDLLASEGPAPRPGDDLDTLMRALSEHLVDAESPESEFDLLTLAGLLDGTLPEAEAEAARSDLHRNERKLRQYVELAAVAGAYEEDAAPGELVDDISGESVLSAIHQSQQMAPIVDLAERRQRRSWIAIASSLAAVLLVGLLLLVPKGQLPGDLDLDVLSPSSRTVRSSTWAIGESLELTASVEADVSWAVVAVAGPTAGQPARVWVAKTASVGGDSETVAPDRVVYREQLTAPAGRRAYLVISSRRSLTDLPALVLDWETQLRGEERRADDFDRDLQSIAAAEAGERSWRISQAVPVAVAEPGL